jgi:hypothetical protein
MNERISLCSFVEDWRETFMMVDYTDFEDLNILREKRKNVCFPCHHREKKFFV